MKNHLLYLLFFVLAPLTIQAQGEEINWLTLDEAIELQAQNPKKIMMDVYTDWCGPCKMLDRDTFQNEFVAKYVNENYYAVKFNAEGTKKIKYKYQEFKNPNHDPNRTGRNAQHEFAQAMQINSYPSIVFFDEESGLITQLPGYKTPSQLEIYLKLFLKDDYKNITTEEAWEAYQTNFKFEF